MPLPTFSLLLTTIGRTTLARTLESLRAQAWRPGDEVMVVSDDQHDLVAQIFQKSGVPGRHLPLLDGPHKDWGHTPRNKTMPQAQGDYIGHFDDDDIFLPDSLARIHLDLDLRPGPVHLYRFLKQATGSKCWTLPPTLCFGCVGTPNIVHPNQPATFGQWGSRYGGDSDFIIQTCAAIPNPIWHDTVIALTSPPADWTLEKATRIAAASTLSTKKRPQSTLARTFADRIPQHRQRQPVTLPDCGVLTAADTHVFSGVQYLVHSLNKHCPIAVVDLGLDDQQLHWLRKRAYVVHPTGPFTREIKGWQTLNKPWYIANSPFRYTLWVDTDCIIVGDLTPVFQHILQQPFVTQHWDHLTYAGGISAQVWAKLPVAHAWTPHCAVNAGVNGFCPQRDVKYLETWQYPLLAAMRDPEILQGLAWWDESALNWMVRALGCFTAVVQKPYWNHLTWSAKVSNPVEAIRALRPDPRDVVLHYSVKDKPWTYWRQVKHLWE